jgi:hypothetical protein
VALMLHAPSPADKKILRETNRRGAENYGRDFTSSAESFLRPAAASQNRWSKQAIFLFCGSASLEKQLGHLANGPRAPSPDMPLDRQPVAWEYSNGKQSGISSVSRRTRSSDAGRAHREDGSLSRSRERSRNEENATNAGKQSAPRRLSDSTRVQKVLASESLQADIHGVPVSSDEEAKVLLFPGSPTIRIDGDDVEPNHANSPGLACRLYANRSGVPSEEAVRLALRARRKE